MHAWFKNMRRQGLRDMKNIGAQTIECRFRIVNFLFIFIIFAAGTWMEVNNTQTRRWEGNLLYQAFVMAIAWAFGLIWLVAGAEQFCARIRGLLYSFYSIQPQQSTFTVNLLCCQSMEKKSHLMEEEEILSTSQEAVSSERETDESIRKPQRVLTLSLVLKK